MTEPVARHQREIAAIVLTAIGDLGFALAGSGALREHGLSERPTQDVDLFTTAGDIGRQFDDAVEQARTALRAAGHQADVHRRTGSFAALVVDADGAAPVLVELGIDWREFPPTRLSIGPVLAITDAVGNKVAALFSRGQLRDFLDVDAIRQSGRFTDADLIRLGRDHDPGFDLHMLGQRLHSAIQLPMSGLTLYGYGPERFDGVRRRLSSWGKTILDGI